MIDKVTMTVTTKIFSKYSKFWWTNIDSETPRAIKKIKKETRHTDSKDI